MTTTTPTSECVSAILAKLGNVRQTSGGYEARCPAHEDKTNSLCIGQGDDGRVLVKCQAGCTTQDVMAAIGLELKDLFPNNNGQQRAGGFNIVAEYDYRDENGTLLYQSCRLDPKDFRQRRPDGNGGFTWNLKGVPRVVYRLPELINSNGEVVFVCEGEKDCDNLHNIGLTATCNPGGAGKWRSEYNEPLRGKHVIITPDNDTPGREHARQVARSLRGIASSVKVLSLPDLDDKGDVSDWLAAGGTAEKLCELAEGAPVWEPTTSAENTTSTSQPTGTSIVEYANPIPLAESLIDTNHRDSLGRLLLRRYRAEFYRSAGSCYTPVTPEAIESETYLHLDTLWTLKRDRATGEPMRNPETGRNKLVKIVPRSSNVREVRLALPSCGVLVEDGVELPCWLDGRTDPSPLELVACRNGLLHLPGDTLHPTTPEFFTTNALDYDYDPQAKRPELWLQFLNELWPDDQQAIGTLQEWFGYCLTHDTRQQKILLLVGPKRSGKGTIARIQTAMLGKNNVCGPTLASLDRAFGLTPLIDKQLAIVTDARLSGRADQAAIAERLLSISGEDHLTIDRKYLPAWHGTLPIKFVILTNELPRIADASGALAGRFVILTLSKSWYGREDTALTAKLRREIPGILNWAIEGWRRLQKRGRLVQPKSSEEAVEELENLGSPIHAFVGERCVIEAGKRVYATWLYQAWKKWCEANGRKPGTLQSFGRDLKAACPSVRVSRPRDGGGNRPRMYEGLDLLSSE